MKKLIKEWLFIIIMLTSLGMVRLFNHAFKNINVQIIFDVVCIMIAIIAFMFEMVWNKKEYSLRDLWKNSRFRKWLVCTIISTIIIILCMLIFLFKI